MANVLAGLEEGVRGFDAALGGLGGCPFAPGSVGNIDTEDLVFLLESEGFDTGIDLPRSSRRAGRCARGCRTNPCTGALPRRHPRTYRPAQAA